MLQSSRDIDERDSTTQVYSLERKPSVAKLTLNGLSYVVSVILLFISYVVIKYFKLIHNGNRDLFFKIIMQVFIFDFGT